MQDKANPLGLDPRLGTKVGHVQPPLEGKVAVVTGAGSGIGKAIAIGLPYAGAKVGILDIDEKGARNTAEFIKHYYSPDSARLMVASVTEPDILKNKYKEVFDHFKRLDILVNCAGIARLGSIDKLSPEDISIAIDVNTKGYFYNANISSQYMIQAKNGGSIINISSASARVISANSSLYGVLKESECMMAREWAADLGPYGIRVNTILAGDLFGEPDLGIVSALWDKGYFNKKAVLKGLVESDDKRLKEDTLNPEIRQMVIDHYVGRTTLKQQLHYRDIIHEIIHLSSEQGEHITGESIAITSGNPSAMSR
ncbi:SDR family NAD(P)-dependent oxidoreductase [Candidatus Neomarinimicrobiota bacterium]